MINQIENLSDTELRKLIVEANDIILQRELNVENEAARVHNEYVDKNTKEVDVPYESGDVDIITVPIESTPAQIFKTVMADENEDDEDRIDVKKLKEILSLV